MENVLKFFLNALKAIFLSPFYLLYFALHLIFCFFNFIIGCFASLFSGFRFGTKKENKYTQLLNQKYEAAKGGNK